MKIRRLVLHFFILGIFQMPISNIISQQALAILSNNGGSSNGIISIPFTVIIQPNLECEYPNFLPGDSTFSIKNNYFNSLYVIAIDDFTGTIYPNEILGYTHVNILKKLNSSNLYTGILALKK